MSNVRKRSYTLLTGATGLLGRYLLRDLLRRGENIAVLVRPTAAVSASKRIISILADWEHETKQSWPMPVVLSGDVVQPGLGLSQEDLLWLKENCHRVLHNAASLTFQGKDHKKEPWRTNLTGTQNLADVCRNWGVRDFHHVSTAYVCGNRSGVIQEKDLQAIDGFRNDYETCKYEAEKWLRAQPELDLTVYRPAVIVGDSQTGYTSTYHGIYRFFQFTSLLNELSPRLPDGTWEHPVRLRLAGSERRNLVPVDWISHVIAELLLRPDSRGKTFHLTPTQPTTSTEIEEALAGFFRYRGVRFVGQDGLTYETMTEYEKDFYRYVEAHEDYFSSEPIFDSSATQSALPNFPPPVVNAACLQRLIDFGEKDRWGKRKRRSTVPSQTV